MHRRRGAGDVDLLDPDLRRDGRDRLRDPRGADDAEHARAVGLRARRHRRALRAEPHDVFAAEQHAHGAAVPVGQLAGS